MAVLRLLRGEDNMAAINHTFLVLIPKAASPDDLSQFRHIALCNVLYKIASKVLANRLKLILSEIVAEEQSTFVPRRLITDNIITTFECLHFMKGNKAKKNRFCALKLDMRKSYDKIEWSYLRGIMSKLGFHQLWVDMVMRLVSTVSFSILFKKSQDFLPSKGLRQGDPISQYLFLLAAEGLSSLIKDSHQLFRVLKWRSRLRQYATYFSQMTACCFSRQQESVSHIRDVLELYCNALGQRVNLENRLYSSAKGARQH